MPLLIENFLLRAHELRLLLKPNDFWDIGILSILCYLGLIIIRGSRAVQVLMGIIILYALNLVATKHELNAVQFVLNLVFDHLFLIMIIVFQDDIRRGLMQLGMMYKRIPALREQSISELLKSIEVLKKKKLGAIIVLERSTGLKDVIQMGAKIDAEMSAVLISSIFAPHSPMHDGAVWIKENRIIAAKCLLPLTKKENLDPSYGTRHRAALGITEQSDALVVVISEERGEVSTVFNGMISSNLSINQLRQILNSLIYKDE